MPFEFRPAKREGVELLIGLSGGTGSGKTYTAMRLAAGICGDDPFAVIDTENGRALHYADFFRFHHGHLRAPFSPACYIEAIVTAARAGYKAIVVDSMSHEWDGEGGVLDMQIAEHKRLGGGDNTKLLSWSMPKQEHKRMRNHLLQLRTHVILCFRAENKIEIAKDDNNRTVVREKQGLTGTRGWFPIAEKNLAYELTTSLLLLADNPGVPVPIKLQEQHKPFFPLDQPITEAAGVAIAAWAKGGPVDWVARIEAVKTKQELAAVGRDLQRAKALLPDTARRMAIDSYNAKLKELESPQ